MSSQQPNLHFSVERWSAENLLQPQKTKTRAILERPKVEAREVETDTHDLVAIEHEKSEADKIAAEERSAAKIKEMVDHNIREKLGMSLDDLKIKLGEIDKIKADVLAFQQEDMRYLSTPDL